ncbi:MAG: PAS domain S-box protein [Chitinophagaceae bacterium]|nr:PAS domain S-box protein [Chitinophagaceae bacterium]
MMEPILSTSIASSQISSNGFGSKAITDIISNGFFTVDRKWTVIYWNRAAERILNTRSEDILGKNLWEQFAGILPLDFYTVYHKAFLQKIPIHFEEYWGEMGGWFDVVTYYCDDRLSVSFKCSNQLANPEYPQHAEKKLQIVNELYKYITEITNDCLWEWGIETEEIFWIDGGHKRVFGYDVENALIPEAFWESRIYPPDKERVLSGIEKILLMKTASVWEEEYRLQRADGEYAYVHDRAHIIRDSNAKPIRMIGATQDITLRKQTEIKLFQSERNLALIAKQTVNAVIITDAVGKITWINSSFTRVTGYRMDEVVGREMGSFLQGKDTNPSTIQYLRRKIKAKEPFTCEILNYGKTGQQCWMLVQGQPLLDEDGNLENYFATETDITERVLLENKLSQERMARQREITKAVLTAQEKERAHIGQELHDNLNQVLAVAKLYIQMANSYERNKNAYLTKSSGYISDVIEEIRRIAKTLVIPGLHGLTLVETINNLLYDHAILDNLKIDFIQKNFDEVEIDEKLQLNIFRVIQEQLTNILKHAKATKGTITLCREGEQVILTISDDGVGLDPKKEQDGVGIINIRSRAELYHGNVTIVTAPGKGYQLKVVFIAEKISAHIETLPG